MASGISGGYQTGSFSCTVEHACQQESIARMVENPSKRPNNKKAAEMRQRSKRQAPGVDYNWVGRLGNGKRMFLERE